MQEHLYRGLHEKELPALLAELAASDHGVAAEQKNQPSQRHAQAVPMVNGRGSLGSGVMVVSWKIFHQTDGNPDDSWLLAGSWNIIINQWIDALLFKRGLNSLAFEHVEIWN